jgi:hypothetical protein
MAEVAGTARGVRPGLYEERGLTLAQRRRAFIAFFWLTLATILVHALAPTGSPLRMDSGSAFNPFTRDVALSPKRDAVPGKAVRLERVSSDGSDRAGGRFDPPPLLAASLFLPAAPQGGARLAIVAPTAFGQPAPRGFQARAPPSA